MSKYIIQDEYCYYSTTVFPNKKKPFAYVWINTSTIQAVLTSFKIAPKKRNVRVSKFWTIKCMYKKMRKILTTTINGIWSQFYEILPIIKLARDCLFANAQLKACSYRRRLTFWSAHFSEISLNCLSIGTVLQWRYVG